MAQSTIKTTFKISPRLLDHFGLSAYNSLKRCLSELASNSYDADATKIDIFVPHELTSDTYIEINDDGEGMSPEQLAEEFLVIGHNKRQWGQRTKRGRLVIGSKGLGKFAGFGIASRIEIVARQNGIESRLTIDRALMGEVPDIAGRTLTIITTPTSLPPGTLVQLSGLNQGLYLPKTGTLRTHLFSALPQTPDFQITINGKLCSAADIKGNHFRINESIPSLGTVHGYYIVAHQPQLQPGISVKVRGRMVVEPTFFGLDSRPNVAFDIRRLVGEVHADFLDPEHGSQSDLINTSRTGLLEDASVVKVFEQRMAEVIARVIERFEGHERDRRMEAILKDPDVRAGLAKLPPEIAPTVREAIKAVIRKSYASELSETVALVLWILRYFESNLLRELLDAILAAEATDTARLASLIEDWGLKQLSEVADVVRAQLRIIDKLQELITSGHSKEIQLHKLIEHNLWLVREGLELWSSDQSLKTLLDGQIDENYRDSADLRPDIVCKSTVMNGEAVIIEFKRPMDIITMKHVTQVLRYNSVIHAHRPEIKFDLYVVGHKYDQEVLASRECFSEVIHFVSFSDLFERARARFEGVLKVLGR